MPTVLSAQERALRGRIGALRLHATHDARETTAKARETFLARFEREVDPDGVLPPAERQRRAEYARKAHFARLALASSIKRSAKKKRTAEPENSAAAAIVAGGARRGPDDQQSQPR